MAFAPKISTELGKPLDLTNVKRNPKGHDYIEGWHAIAEANRIFGFDGWWREMIELTENTPPTKNSNGNHIVSFRARVRVTAGDVVREGTGFGSGIAKDIHDAYEGAIKEAETDAMKRALMTFGNPFGLALYDKSRANVCDGPDRAEAYVDTAGAIIDSYEGTEAELRDWWNQEGKARRDNNLSQTHVNTLLSKLKARIEVLNKQKEPA